MYTLMSALQSVENRVGDVVAPRLRKIALDEPGADRARLDLVAHLKRIEAGNVASEVMELQPDEALRILTDLGHPPAGRTAHHHKPVLRERPHHRIRLYLTDEEVERIEAVKGEKHIVEWIRDAALAAAPRLRPRMGMFASHHWAGLRMGILRRNRKILVNSMGRVWFEFDEADAERDTSTGLHEIDAIEGWDAYVLPPNVRDPYLSNRAGVWEQHATRETAIEWMRPIVVYAKREA